MQGDATSVQGRARGRPGRAGEGLSTPIVLAAVPIVAVLSGWLLDRRLHTFPWATLTLLVLGFVGAGRELWLAAKQASKDDQDGST